MGVTAGIVWFADTDNAMRERAHLVMVKQSRFEATDPW
jgi:hypothetical protein